MQTNDTTAVDLPTDEDGYRPEDWSITARLKTPATQG